jgi:hypothetical protein
MSSCAGGDRLETPPDRDNDTPVYNILEILRQSMS